MSAQPDLAGFTDAQKRLREAFGEVVEFLAPAVETYPAGTKLDPETDRPMDPLVEPDSSTTPIERVKCNVAFKPTRAEADESGWRDVEHVRLIADISDRAKIDGAVRARVRGQTYRIVSMTPDGIGGVQRYLVEAHKE